MNPMQNRDTDKTKEELFQELATLRQQLSEQEHEVWQARESTEAANRIHHEFLANISHEIRTPMNAILGIAELLLETPLTPEQQEFVRIFQTNGDMLLQTLNNLIGFSEVSTQKITLDMTDFDLLALVETTCRFLAPRAHQKGLELNYYLDPSFPTFLRGDPGRLRQIFINLIGNGIKFTEEGEVMIHCECLSESPERVEWLFSISDTGIGIPKPRLKKILDSLSHAERAPFKLGAEIELGLAISKHLIELMNGRIWVESDERHGSIFHFTTTFARQKEPQKPVRIYPERLRGLHVLVVDDNATNRSILKTILQRWGARVTEVNNGRQGALELQRAYRANEPYDLILLDSVMPRFDGFQMAEYIQGKPEITSVPIMMLTANDLQELLEKTGAIDISAYMLKPIKRFDLLHAIGTALQQSSESEALPSRMSEAKIGQQGLRILLVEDYTHNQMIVQQYLKDTSHHLDIAENGAIAVEKFTQTYYDLILMDMQMPVMDGYAATENIRTFEREHHRKETPIIALTAYALKDAPEKSRRAGCNAHLSKPLKKSQLLEILLRYHREPTSTDTQEGKLNQPQSTAPATSGDSCSHHGSGAEEPGEPHIVCVQQEFAECIPEFFSDLRQDLQAMITALQRNDYETIRTMSHSIKGAGGGYGLDAISDITRKLETAANQEDRDAARQQLDSLATYLEQTQVVYRTHSGESKTIVP